jgi:hypothetical protein
MLRRELTCGDTLPWWMGVAWVEPNRDVAVALPLGVHWVAGVARSSWNLARIAVVPDLFVQAYERGYKMGYEDAHAHEMRRRAAIEYLARQQAFEEGFAAGLSMADDPRPKN